MTSSFLPISSTVHNLPTTPEPPPFKRQIRRRCMNSREQPLRETVDYPLAATRKSGMVWGRRSWEDRVAAGAGEGTESVADRPPQRAPALASRLRAQWSHIL
jgi:hypothetical protein